MTREEIIKRYKNLDLFSQGIVVDCMKILMPISLDEIERIAKEILKLSDSRLEVIACIISSIEWSEKMEWFDFAKERKMLLEIAKLGSYFTHD